MSRWMQLGFEDACCSNMKNLIAYHDLVMFVAVVVSVVVFSFMVGGIWSEFTYRCIGTSQKLEFGWTLFPMFWLGVLIGPSIHVLYVMDEVVNAFMNLKVIGRQWYWSYQYPVSVNGLVDNFTFDSYMVSMEELKEGDYRLLEVDKRAVIPAEKTVRILVTSMDVLHCWTLGGMGVKVDAVPGRLNQVSVNSFRCGVFFGQCSEICGANHSFMPIVVEVLPLGFFNSWLLGLSNSE
uniref:Cytochrome c oxidase subunit 2 n=1 Tax=Myadora brevis TaxID=457650 RepID=A0A1U9XPI8_9BIVA|nr:cytochrome c oxidase subunit II [Myadora brevis]AQZ26165.1 cytochrome c oxidase subunit II [Myadora brevis]